MCNQAALPGLYVCQFSRFKSSAFSVYTAADFLSYILINSNARPFPHSNSRPNFGWQPYMSKITVFSHHLKWRPLP